MSQTPTARASPAGSPAPGRASSQANLESIYTNIPILINRVRNNQLATAQIPPLRNLLANHAKEIIVFHAKLGRNNPLLSLPDVLNPTKKVGENEAITTENAFLSQVRAGIELARTTRPDQALIAAMAAKQAAAKPAGQGPVQQRVQSTVNSAAASPATSPGASGTPVPPAPAAAAPSTPAVPPTQPPPGQPLQAPPMTLQQVKEIIAMPQDQRTAKLEADPVLKQRFVASYTFYQRKTVQARAPGTGTATPPPQTAPVRPPQAAARTASPAPGSGAATPSQTTAPVRPPTAPRVPSPPPEPEPMRRRRKLREYMREQAPALDLELGIDSVFSDVLDSMVDSVIRDSVRLAAHRASNRVELKDIAYVLDNYHDIVVPGFNAQVPKRIHLDPDEKKRAKVVAPRARRDDKE